MATQAAAPTMMADTTAAFVSPSPLEMKIRMVTAIRVMPDSGDLHSAQEAVRERGGVCIADEVQTGLMRTGQMWGITKYGVTPDICTLGKIIGGGFPLAALGASTEIMAHFDASIVGRDHWLMQLGTLSGNPVAAAAGLKTMEILRRPGQYEKLRSLGKTLMGTVSSMAPSSTST